MTPVLAENPVLQLSDLHIEFASDIRASALPIVVRVSWTVLWDRVHSTVVNQRWAED